MLIGTTTKSFGGRSCFEAAELFARCGIGCAELYFCQSDLDGWKYNFSGAAALPSAQLLYEKAQIYRSFGIEIAAIGVYSDILPMTASDVCESVKSYSEYCSLARSVGCTQLSTHAGTFIHTALSQKHDASVNQRLYDGLCEVLVECAKYGITLCMECGEGNVICGFEDYVKFKAYIEKSLGRSDMLKYTFDSCEALSVPTHEIGLCHVRDRKHGGRYYEPFGGGDMDFTLFFEKFGNTDIPMILEYVNSASLMRTAESFRGCAYGYEKNNGRK